MSAMVINEVATAECIDRGKLARSAGTMTNPPPTPRNPERKPAAAPMTHNREATGKVQTRRPVAGSTAPNVAVDARPSPETAARTTAESSLAAPDWRYILIATKASTAQKMSCSAAGCDLSAA